MIFKKKKEKVKNEQEFTYARAFHTNNICVVHGHFFYFFFTILFCIDKKNLYPQNGSAMIASISSMPS